MVCEVSRQRYIILENELHYKGDYPDPIIRTFPVLECTDPLRIHYA